MKCSLSLGLMVVLTAVMVAGAAINTGEGPTYLYQRDVHDIWDANAILNEAQYNSLQRFEESQTTAWIGQTGRAETVGMVFHFQASFRYAIQSADVFTRSYLWDTHSDNLSLDAYWGTTPHRNIWDYYGGDTRFYHRQNHSGRWIDENTTTINVGGARDLFLTFTTYQSGYADMDRTKKWFVSEQGLAAPPGFNVSLNVAPNPPVIMADGHQLLIDGQPLRGMFVDWHLPGIDAQHNEAWYRNEFKKMKNLGVIGVGIEIGWNECEPQDDQFVFDTLWQNQVIEWAGKESLWVHLLLTPHYTPDWVFTKHGDVKMKNVGGSSQDGSFLTFSPSSPAVDDQIDFQYHAVQYFQKYPHLLAVFLTNEQGYASRGLDYSTWAAAAWNAWLRGISADPAYWRARWSIQDPVPPADTPLPTSSGEGRKWKDWLLFRQQEFNKYLNRLYDGAVSARTRFIPIAHKLVFYNMYDAYAPQWGLHYTPIQTRMDVVACDAYCGTSPVMGAGALAFGKPIFLAETNFNSTPTGPDGQGDIARMLMDQYTQGIQNQTLYAWNPYDGGSFPWGLMDAGGNPLTGTLGMAQAAGIVGSITGSTGLLPGKSGLIVPTDRFNSTGDQYWVFQYPWNSLLASFGEFGLYPHVLHSDDINPSGYPGRAALGPAVSLAGYKVISATSTAESADQDALASSAIQNWVNGGGVLFVELWDGTLPSWMGITAATTSRTTYSHYLTTTWLQGHAQSRSSGISWRLSSGVSGTRIWARWDGSTYNAVLAVPRGSGWVVAAGTLIFDAVGKGSQAQPLLWDILELAGYAAPPVSPMGPTYRVMNNMLYLATDAAWSGSVALPAGYAHVGVIRQYDADAVARTATLSWSGGRLTGGLGANEFCLVELLP